MFPLLKYIVFDFDGTLVDSLDIIVTGYNQMAEKYRAKTVEPDDIPRLKGMTIPERARYLNFRLYMFPLAALDIYKLYRQSLRRLRFFAGMRELLTQLHEQGFKLGIISTNSEHNIREFLERNGIGFIDDFHCSNNIFGKDKDIRKFLKVNKIKNTEMIYVGDEARDIVACQKNRVPVIWVSWGYDSLENIQRVKPDYLVDRPEEILSCIRAHS